MGLSTTEDEKATDAALEAGGPRPAPAADGRPRQHLPARPAGSHPAPGRRAPTGAAGAADRLGQERGVLHRHPHAAGPWRRAHPARVAPAGPHAQPDRGRPAHGRAGGHHQQRQPRRVGRHRRTARRGQRRHPPHLARAPGQPQVPGRRPARGRPPQRAAGDRRGPLHLRLGPRLPPRLPPPGPGPRPVAERGAGPVLHGHRQRPGGGRRHRPARLRRRLRPGAGAAAPGTA